MRDLTLRLILHVIADQFNNALNAARNQLGDLSGSARSSDNALGGFQQRVNQSFRSVLDFGGAIRGLIAGFSLLAIVAGVKSLVQFADSLRLIEGRIKNASAGTADFVKNYAQLFFISFKTGTSFAENANMFARINTGVQAMGGTSKDSLRQVDLLAKGLVISGAAASESASTIRQWSQAMASGLLRGDEFNSIMENSPRIAKALADGLGVNIGVLRAMAEAGELTAAKVAEALVKQGKAIDEEFKKIPVSVGTAFEKVKTAFGQYVADADRGKGATAGLASSLEALANNIVPVVDALITVAKAAVLVGFSVAASSAIAYVQALRLARAEQAELAANSALARQALITEAQAELANTEALIANTSARSADIAATQAVIASARAEATAKLAVTNASIAQTRASIAAMQSTVQSTTITWLLAQATNELAASEVRRAVIVSELATLGAQNAAVSAQLTAAQAAQTEATAALTLAQERLSLAQQGGIARNASLASSFIGLKGVLNAFNIVLVGVAGYMLGEWLRSFSVVRVGAIHAVDGIMSAVAQLEYYIKRAKLNWQYKFDFSDEGAEELKQKMAELEAEFIAGAQARAVAKNGMLEEEAATSKVVTETDKLIDSFKATKTPQQTFVEKSRELTKELNQGRISTELYTKALLSLHNAMQADIAKQQTPFEKERTELQDNLDKATLSADDYQRQQYLKTFSAEETERLMLLFRQTEQNKTIKKELSQTVKSLSKETLDSEIAAIKIRQDAATDAHNLELKQLDANYKAQELSLTQQNLDDLSFQEKSIALAKDLADAKLKIEKDFIEQSAALNRTAIEARIKAAQQEASAVKPSSASFAGLIAGGEGGAASYNAYNKGTASGKIIPADKPVDLASLTIAEIQSRQALAITDQDRLFAVGKYQVITSTLKEAVQSLKMSADTKFDAATQERIFTEYLVAAKRPSIKDYIIGQSSDSAVAQLNTAQEFRSVADPRTGLTYADKGQKANKASISTEQFQAALNTARAQYQTLTSQGVDTDTAFKTALSGSAAGGGSLEKIKMLQAELVASEADKDAKLKALGIDAQNNATEQSAAELELRNTALAEQQALDEEEVAAQHDAALDELAMREQSAQQDLDLGNITEEEHLERLRQFAAERLAIELKLLDEKRKLLGDDKLALAQNLHEQEAVQRAHDLEMLKLAGDAEKERKEVFEGMIAPFKNAMSQMTNGILTGQQTITHAVKNSVNSILTSYAATFIEQRVMQTAQWAWEKSNLALNESQKQALKEGDLIWTVWLYAKEKAVMAAHWAWDVLGFGAKETTKTGIQVVNDGAQVGSKVLAEGAKAGAVVVGETIQTGAVAAGESARSSITLLGTLKTIGAKAAQAAAGAFSWVMTEVPFPLNMVLAPVAAAGAFLGTMAFGSFASSKDGEWDVPEDRLQFVHKRETILPAWAAEPLREMVTRKQTLTPSAAVDTVNQLFASGQLPKQLSLPASALNLVNQSQSSAASLARDRVKADKERIKQDNSRRQRDELHIHTISAKDLFSEHSGVVVKQLGKEARRFNTGKN